MAITPKAAASVSAPNTLTGESEASVAVPNTLTGESVASVAVPNTLTGETAASVAVPNTLTGESVASVAVPNTLTGESVASVAVPNTLTGESVASVAVPNTLTGQSVAAVPRSLTPAIKFDFEDQLFQLGGVAKALSDIATYTRSSSASFLNRRVDGLTGDYEYFIDNNYVGTVTNLLTYSEQFDNADWSKTRASVTANATLDPNGNRTADKLIEDATASNTHYVEQAITITASADATLTVYAKADENKDIRIGIGSATSNAAYFDIQSGVITSTGSSVIPGISYAGNGWYKCDVTLPNATGGSTGIQVMLADDTSASYTGDGSSGLYIWGAQLTESAKPLPYVKTTSASDSDTFTASPRYEYDAATGDSLGILIEGASTNLALRSEEFTTTWTQSAVSATDDVVLAPDGTASGGKLDEDSATSDHLLFQAVSVTSGNDYSLSIYARASENPYMQLTFQSSFFGSLYANFDLVTGTVAVESSCTASIQDVGNGWYRCAISATATSTGSANAIIALIESSLDARSPSYAGTAGDGVYIWGAQVEEQLFATSYIRTEGSSVSRGADNLTADASIISKPNSLSIASKLHIDNLPAGGTGGNRYAFRVQDSGGDCFQRIDNNGNLSGICGLTTISYSTDGNYSDSFDTVLTRDSTTSTYIGGVLANSSTDSGFISDSSGVIGIGRNFTAADHMYGHIKEFTIYDETLTAQEVSLI